MSGLKEIRARISSVKSTMQITSAMKSVAAAKLKRDQDAVLAVRPYANKIRQLLIDTVSIIPKKEQTSPFCINRDIKKVLVINITSNRGLCGAFNTNVIKKTYNVCQDYKNKGLEVDILHIGKKGKTASILKSFSSLESKDDSSNIFNNIGISSNKDTLNWILDLFLKGVYDKVELIYNKFINPSLQNPTSYTLLPIKSLIDDNDKSVNNYDSKINDEYIYESSKKDVLDYLVSEKLKVAFYEILLDSLASEHGARMTAMHQATENAKDLTSNLTIIYNKARQAAITKEILEIVGGAEALK